MDRPRDLLLVVLSPLLIIPVMLLVQTRVSPLEIAIYVAAFGALGHHLPGMLRVYGDPSLFARFRVRFIVGPIFLIAVCMYFVQYDLESLKLIVLLWGFWHGVMQIYGFLRIYDAKARSTAALTARLDFWMVMSWFGLGLILSGGHVSTLLTKFYVSGGSMIPVQVMRGAQVVVAVLTGLVTIAWLINMALRWRAGTPPSLVKLTLLTSSIAFYWFAMVYTPDPLLGVALFEVFHDVQYLAIVWAFNGKLVAGEKGEAVGSFTRFLFRRTWPLAILYVGLVLAYGALGLLVPSLIQGGALPKAIGGVLIASALLHFYFDGFIWKVRQESTRAGLGLEGGQGELRGALGLPLWILHILKWGLFVVPLLHLGFAQVRHPPTLDHFRNVVACFPTANNHNELGIRLAKRQETSAEAARHFEAALALDPRLGAAHLNLAAFYSRTRPEEALRHFERAAELEPTNAALRANVGDQLSNMGRLPEAIEAYEASLAIAPSDAVAVRLKVAQARLAQAKSP